MPASMAETHTGGQACRAYLPIQRTMSPLPTAVLSAWLSADARPLLPGRALIASHAHGHTPLLPHGTENPQIGRPACCCEALLMLPHNLFGCCQLVSLCAKAALHKAGANEARLGLRHAAIGCRAAAVLPSQH